LIINSIPTVPMKLYQFQRGFDRSLDHEWPPCYWLAQGVLTGLFIMHSILLQPPTAAAVELDVLCQRSPLNSRCQNPISERPVDVVPDSTKPQVIKIKLNDLSGVSEWIRAEIRGSEVRLLHTVVTQSGLSKGISAITKLPFAIAHTWYDHPASRIAFWPDDCENSDCLVLGTDSITLPAAAQMYRGRFMMEYTESGWVRTITFKLPDPSSNCQTQACHLMRK
jgi:hypothetical protein